MDRKSHWQRVYATKEPTAVSWYQAHADRSVDLIRSTGVPREAAIIDVGSGASRLIDDLVATFAEDGPMKCSGLPVQRYSPRDLHSEFGPRFELVRSEREVHVTPAGAEQRFVYCCFRLLDD